MNSTTAVRIDETVAAHFFAGNALEIECLLGLSDRKIAEISHAPSAFQILSGIWSLRATSAIAD